MGDHFSTQVIAIRYEANKNASNKMGAKMQYKAITAKKVKVNDSKGNKVDRYLLVRADGSYVSKENFPDLEEWVDDYNKRAAPITRRLATFNTSGALQFLQRFEAELFYNSFFDNWYDPFAIKNLD